MNFDYHQKRRQLTEDGFCLLPNVLDAAMLSKLRQVTDALLARTEAAHFDEHRAQGSIITVFEEPFFTQLVCHQPILDAWHKLGFADPKWGSGFVISKPPQSPPLFWHQDGRFWDDPISYTPRIVQCFVMIYLVETTRENGCLRLIPGSHLKRHALHDALPEAHQEALSRVDDPNHRAFQRAEGEVDVPVKAGDLVIGSARLLHAARANQSDARRTNITLWYYPDFANLPAGIQAFLGGEEKAWKRSWREAGPPELEKLRATYSGDALPIKNNRVPGPAFV